MDPVSLVLVLWPCWGGIRDVGIGAASGRRCIGEEGQSCCETQTEQENGVLNLHGFCAETDQERTESGVGIQEWRVVKQEVEETNKRQLKRP